MLLLMPPHPLITRLVLSSMWVCVCVFSPIQLFVTPWTVASILSAHGIFQARILEWVAIFYSRGSSYTHISKKIKGITGWDKPCLLQSRVYKKRLENTWNQKRQFKQQTLVNTAHLWLQGGKSRWKFGQGTQFGVLNRRSFQLSMSAHGQEHTQYRLLSGRPGICIQAKQIQS